MYSICHQRHEPVAAGNTRSVAVSAERLYAMERGMSIARYFGMLEVLIVFLGSAAPNAQRSAQNRLETATSVTCEFPLYATGTWTNGEPQAEVKTAKLSLGFDSIDTQGGTARSLGTFGNSDIVERLSHGSLHFMLVGSSGLLYITTVFDRRRFGRE